MARYTLRAKIDGYDLPIKIFENGKYRDKVSLIAIDNYTMGNEPIYILRDCGIKEANLKGYVKFYIAYNNYGPKTTEVLFNDTFNLKKMANASDRQINYNSAYKKFINYEFLPRIKDSRFVLFLRQKKLLNDKLYEWIESYIRGKYDDNFCYSKIIEHISDYKTVRDLIIGITLYDKLNEFGLNKLETEETIKPYTNRHLEEMNRLGYDPDIDGFMSEEDWMRYYKKVDSECEFTGEIERPKTKDLKKC